MVRVWVSKLPRASTTVQVTLEVPTGKIPFAGNAEELDAPGSMTEMTTLEVRSPSQVSDAVTVLANTAPRTPASAGTEKDAGTLARTGGLPGLMAPLPSLQSLRATMQAVV